MALKSKVNAADVVVALLVLAFTVIIPLLITNAKP